MPKKQVEKVIKKVINHGDISKVDINFPEFCLGVVGKNRSDNQPDKIEYFLKNDPGAKITVVRSGHGFPDQTTRDVLHTLMRITHKKNAFNNQFVYCTLREILKEMGKSVSGSSVKMLRNHLNILMGTTITFENSFFDKRKGTKENTVVAFSILSGYMFREMKSINEKQVKISQLSLGEKGMVAWNPLYFERSVQTAKNLIDFDYSFYLTLKQDYTKQLYLFLSKRSYSSNKLRMPLDELAFTVLGMSTSLRDKPYKVRFALKKSHEQLYKNGFLPVMPEFDKDGSGSEYVTYKLAIQKRPLTITFNESLEESKPQFDETQQSNEYYNSIKSILTTFGATDGQIARLVRTHPLMDLLEALKQIQLQYSERSKVKNIIGLVSKLMEQGSDLSLVTEQSRKEKEVKQNQIEEEKLRLLQEREAARKQKEQEQLNARIDSWIGANTFEFIRITENFLESRVKSNPVLKMFLDKEMQSADLSPSAAVMSHKALRALLREEVGKMVSQSA